MKKVLALLLALLAVAAFCSCDPASVISSLKPSRGAVANNVYTNESANLTFTKPDNMVFATDEEIAAMMDVAKDILNDGDKLFEIADLAVIYEFMAKDLVSGNNISMIFENLVKTGSSQITEDQYLSVTKNQLKAQAGLTYTFGETSDIKLGEETFKKLSATATYNGITMEQAFYVRKMDKYMLVITMTSVDGTPMSTFEAMFS